MSSTDEIVAEFTEITGANAGTAKFFLESSNWSLQDALSNYLAESNENEDRSDEVADNEDDDANLMPPTNSNRAGASQQTDDTLVAKSNKKTGSSRTTRPKIATLHNMSQNSSSDEEGQAFYAGGSERSGQQVLGPPKRKNFREKLTDMFRQAHEQTHDHPAPSTSSSGATWGIGLRLGQTENDHSVVNAGGKNDAKNRQGESVILKLWSQGFSINDGALRLYDDPENKEFLETVMRGEIPIELMEMGSMVSVDVEDHRQEDFKCKVTKAQSFKGPGQTLGSPAPNIVSDTPPTSSAASNEGLEKEAAQQIKVNNDEELTQLQIRLADGSRLTSHFNLTHTVGDIRMFIQTARPHYSSIPFNLVSSFPTRELNDDTLTIEKLGLKNAAILQRLK